MSGNNYGIPPPAYWQGQQYQGSHKPNFEGGDQQYQFKQNQYYNLNHDGPGAPIGDSFDDKFPVEDRNRNKFNDWPFTVLFLATVSAFTAIAVITIRAWLQNRVQSGSGINNGTSGTLNTGSAVLLLSVVGIALIASVLGFILAFKFPKAFIYLGMVVNIISGLAVAAMYFYMRQLVAGIILLVLTVFLVFCFYTMRSRIPLSVAILRTVMSVITKYPQTWVVSSLGTFVAGVFSILFSAVIVSTYIKYDPSPTNGGCNTTGGNCSKGTLIGMLVLVFFCGYYISEVIRNVIHTTISGIFGSWYYYAMSDQGMPRWPAFGSFKRAITTSFGSICFGSLIVSLIQLVRQLINLLRSGIIAEIAENAFVSCIFIVLDLIIGVFEWMVEYFNHYAYSFIALYGKPYIRSAKETWHMIREKGLDALVNDNLINLALGFYTFFVGCLTAVFAYFFLRFSRPDYNSQGAFNLSLMTFSFLVASQIVHIATETIRSGTATFFVALGNNPEIFQISHPETFHEIFRAYPNVLNKLNYRNV